MHNLSLYGIIALSALLIQIVSAFDSTEIRMLEEEQNRARQPFSYADTFMKRAASPLIRFGKREFNSSPLIRFGKRSPGAPLIRFGRSPDAAPLIRFGRSMPMEGPLIRFGRSPNSAPLIRFGKRSPAGPLIRFGRAPEASPLIRFGKRSAGDEINSNEDEE